MMATMGVCSKCGAHAILYDYRGTFTCGGCVNTMRAVMPVLIDPSGGSYQGNVFYGGTPYAVPPQRLPPAVHGLPTGHKVEDLIGWRVWTIRGLPPSYGAPHLWSFSAGHRWKPDEPMTGVPGDHDAAGVWAFKTEEAARRKMLQSGPGHAYGSVRLWGQVVEHTEGYRAEFARVLTIEDATDRSALPELRERYGDLRGVAGPPTPASPPRCKDCRHFRRDRVLVAMSLIPIVGWLIALFSWCRFSERFGMCSNPEVLACHATCLISGELFAENARLPNFACGPDGRFFEPRS